MKILLYWSSRIWRVSLDESTAKFHRKFAALSSPKRYTGWAYKSNRKWFAVYREDDMLQFRCEEWICAIDEYHSCQLIRRSGQNLFLLKVENKIVFQHEYESRDWAKRGDPTYDQIDAEDDDFFLWLFRLWGDAKRVKNTIERLSH